MTVNERIAALRKLMRENGVDAYVVPSDDYHCSEYVGDYFKARGFLSGFDGSAGTVVVTMDEAGLWTDGRYFLQAGQQLAGTEVKLFKMGQPGVPTIEAYLADVMPEGGVLGFDGRTVAYDTAKRYEQALAAKHVTFWHGGDLVDGVWAERPAMLHTPVKVLPLSICGKPAADKLAQVRAEMEKQQTDLFVLAMLDDINWMLNIRADDVHCNPVVLSYAVIGTKQAWLFADAASFGAEQCSYLHTLGVELLPYDSVYAFLRENTAGKRVLIDYGRVNYEIASSIAADATVSNRENMTILMKSIKNETEVANMVQAHIKDGVAYTKFIYWLKQNIGKIPMTELSAAAYLEKMRCEQPGYWGISFDTICGYAHHGAIVHYDPTPETDIPLQAENLLLVDAGGHYDEGTTDITRTIALGEMDAEQKTFYTAVLRGHLNLAAAKFLEGCSGMNLDYLARQPLWDMGIDYNHGTGHGVGYLLSVHEGPQGFRWRKSPTRTEGAALCENMITSDEPGVYFEGKWGIRLENLIVCRKAEQNEYGQFMQFEYLTLVPFDLDAVDPAQMSEKERALLNAYHKRVYETIAPHLTEAEAAWLKQATRAI